MTGFVITLHVCTFLFLKLYHLKYLIRENKPHPRYRSYLFSSSYLHICILVFMQLIWQIKWQLILRGSWWTFEECRVFRVAMMSTSTHRGQYFTAMHKCTYTDNGRLATISGSHLWFRALYWHPFICHKFTWSEKSTLKK